MNSGCQAWKQTPTPNRSPCWLHTAAFKQMSQEVSFSWGRVGTHFIFPCPSVFRAWKPQGQVKRLGHLTKRRGDAVVLLHQTARGWTLVTWRPSRRSQLRDREQDSRPATPLLSFVQDNKNSAPQGQGSPAFEGSEPAGKSVTIGTQALSVEFLTRKVWAGVRGSAGLISPKQSVDQCRVSPKPQ